MARIDETFNIGDRSNITPERLLEILETMYTDIAVQLNKKVEFVERNSDGLTTDTFLSNSTVNINSSTNKVEMLTKHVSPTSVTWTKLS